MDELRDLGFTVLEASNSTEAVAVLRANPSVQVVFTDIDMPGGVDGLELAAAVRDHWPPIKIIVTSGHRVVNASDLPEVDEFLPKPYSGDAVAGSIRELLT